MMYLITSIYGVQKINTPPSLINVPSTFSAYKYKANNQRITWRLSSHKLILFNHVHTRESNMQSFSPPQILPQSCLFIILLVMNHTLECCGSSATNWIISKSNMPKDYDTAVLKISREEISDQLNYNIFKWYVVNDC